MKLPSLRPGESIPPDRVLVLGRLAMNPPVVTSFSPTYIDATGGRGKVFIAFSADPHERLDLAASSTSFVNAVPDGVLAFTIERRPQHLRMIGMTARVHSSMTMMHGRATVGGVDAQVIKCPVDLQFAPEREDVAIYIGKLVCHYAPGDEAEIFGEGRVYGEWEWMAPHFAPYVDPALVKARYPRPIPPRGAAQVAPAQR